jgi:hypothetical protein
MTVTEFTTREKIPNKLDNASLDTLSAFESM